MEYQEIRNFLDNTPKQPSKFRSKNWIEINDDASGTHNTNSQFKFKTTMLKSSLCGYSDAKIPVKGTIIITGGPAAPAEAAKWTDERYKGVIFKYSKPFTDCISEINNTQADNAKYLDAVMLMYNPIEYSDNYAKWSGSLWQYYEDEPHGTMVNSESFKSKMNITGKTPASGNTEDVEIAESLKYLNNFWRTLEIPLTNCEINVIVIWSVDCVILSATETTKFAITYTKLYVPVVALSAQGNAKILQELNSGFK